MAQTPSTWADYVGNGVEDTFQVTFPYQKQQEVFVTVGGAPAAFTFISAGWVKLAAAPANGAAIRVQRSTEAFDPRHEFANGVPLLPRFIDENNKQFLYVVQEATNETAGTAAEALSQASQAVATADAAAALIDDALQDSALYLRNDLANSTDPAKGAGLVGFQQSGAGAVARTVGSKLGDAVSAKDFGAAGDGVTDDTYAVQKAVSHGNVSFVGMSCVITGTITLPDEKRLFTGDVGDNIIFKPTLAGTPLFSAARKGSKGLFVFENIGAVAASANAVFFRGEETRAGTGPFVVGANDFVKFYGCRLVSGSPSGGYWRHITHMVNSGGVVFVNSTAANFDNTTAQNDINTAAFFFDQRNRSFSVIRGLHADNFYTQRFYVGVKFAVENSVESVYLGQGEMVGHFYGLDAYGPGTLSAININGTHMDCISRNIRSTVTSGFSVARLTSADLRLGSNGAASVDAAGVNIEVRSGSYFTISGGFLDARVATQKGIVVVNNVPGLSVAGVTFRRQSIAIDAPTVTDAQLSANYFENVTTRYNLASTDKVRVEAADYLQLSVAQFTGGLDTLAGPQRSLTVTRLGTGFTNGPAGVSGAGHVCTTIVWDVNAAHQEIRAISPPHCFIRRKSGGVWGSWFYQPAIDAGTGIVFISGSGSPEGVITGSKGSLFLRTDGGAGTTLYVKESGTGNVGWVAK